MQSELNGESNEGWPISEMTKSKGKCTAYGSTLNMVAKIIREKSSNASSLLIYSYSYFLGIFWCISVSTCMCVVKYSKLVSTCTVQAKRNASAI